MFSVSLLKLNWLLKNYLKSILNQDNINMKYFQLCVYIWNDLCTYRCQLVFWLSMIHFKMFFFCNSVAKKVFRFFLPQKDPSPTFKILFQCVYELIFRHRRSRKKSVHTTFGAEHLLRSYVKCFECSIYSVYSVCGLIILFRFVTMCDSVHNKHTH